jgi:hypothetical protein
VRGKSIRRKRAQRCGSPRGSDGGDGAPVSRLRQEDSGRRMDLGASSGVKNEVQGKKIDGGGDEQRPL